MIETVELIFYGENGTVTPVELEPYQVRAIVKLLNLNFTSDTTYTVTGPSFTNHLTEVIDEEYDKLLTMIEEEYSKILEQ